MERSRERDRLCEGRTIYRIEERMKNDESKFTFAPFIHSENVVSDQHPPPLRT